MSNGVSSSSVYQLCAFLLLRQRVALLFERGLHFRNRSFKSDHKCASHDGMPDIDFTELRQIFDVLEIFYRKPVASLYFKLKANSLFRSKAKPFYFLFQV